MTAATTKTILLSPIQLPQDLQLFLSCLHQVAVAQISQWHDSLQATVLFLPEVWEAAATTTATTEPTTTIHNKTILPSPRQVTNLQQQKRRTERKETKAVIHHPAAQVTVKVKIWFGWMEKRKLKCPKNNWRRMEVPALDGLFVLSAQRRTRPRLWQNHIILHGLLFLSRGELYFPGQAPSAIHKMAKNPNVSLWFTSVILCGFLALEPNH